MQGAVPAYKAPKMGICPFVHHARRAKDGNMPVCASCKALKVSARASIYSANRLNQKKISRIGMTATDQSDR